jgi:hypothetical protein
MCVVLFYLSFRPLRLCVTITNLRDDKGRNSKQNVLKSGIEPHVYLKIRAESNRTVEKNENVKYVVVILWDRNRTVTGKKIGRKIVIEKTQYGNDPCW